MKANRVKNKTLRQRIRELNRLERLENPVIPLQNRGLKLFDMTNVFLLTALILIGYLFVQLDNSYEEETKARALQAYIRDVGSPKAPPMFEFKSTNGVNPNVTALMTAKNLTFLQVDMESVIDLNEDVRGWLRVPGTSIDYAFAQGVNNDFYLERDLNKRTTVTGWVFLDSSNNGKVNDFNSLIYAHNRADDVMFGGLKKLLEPTHFDTPANHYIQVTTPTEYRVYSIVAVYTTKAYDVNYQIINGSPEDKQRFITHAVTNNTIPTLQNTNLAVSDNYLTLSTCHGFTGTDTRLVVQARLEYKTER